MGRRALPVFLGLILVSAFLAGRSDAEGLSGYLEYNYTSSDSESADATGRSTRLQSNTFLQRYSVTLDKKFFPNLGLLAGGFFEKRDTDTDIDGAKDDSSTTTLRPYVNVNLRTPLYSAEVEWRRNEEKQKGTGQSSNTTVRETFTSTLYWKPDGFPDAKFQASRNNSFDKDRRTLDTTEDRFEFTTQYWPVKSLYLRYQGWIDAKEDRLNDTTVDEVTHNGKIIYADSWWRKRVSVSSDYSFVRDETKTSSGGGEVSFQVIALAALSAISDTPETGTLDATPPLIDGNLTAGTGINLGLPAPGGDARPRNLGLDFGTETEVNSFLVYVDRDVTQVADSFSWRVYTSTDNLNWVFAQTVSPAVFSAFFLRFEIRFANVKARYVKVVVSPLSPATPFATSFPTISVTELQAELRKPAAAVTGRQTATTHIYNLDIRTRILESPSLVYELSYFLVKKDPSATPAIFTISNGLSFQHRFSTVFSGRARVAREDGQEKDGSRVAYLYTAAVTAVPLETLLHTLVYSGKNETVAGNMTSSNSLFLYNNAKLYEGIDVSLGGGFSSTEEESGRMTDSTQVNASATLVPNTVVTINLVYNDTSTKTKGGNVAGETTDSLRAWESDLGITPVRTVYLFGSYRLEDRTQKGVSDRRNIKNYTVNWSPFPDGTLHLNLYYNETLRSEDDSRERSFVPSLRWNITPRSYLDLSYQKLRTESRIQTTDNRVVSGTVRIAF